MANTKDAVQSSSNLLVTSGLSGKSITSLDVWVHGVVAVIQIGYSGGNQYIKIRQGVIEYGGTQDWGTGTLTQGR